LGERSGVSRGEFPTPTEHRKKCFGVLYHEVCVFYLKKRSAPGFRRDPLGNLQGFLMQDHTWIKERDKEENGGTGRGRKWEGREVGG